MQGSRLVFVKGEQSPRLKEWLSKLDALSASRLSDRGRLVRLRHQVIFKLQNVSRRAEPNPNWAPSKRAAQRTSRPRSKYGLNLQRSTLQGCQYACIAACPDSTFVRACSW